MRATMDITPARNDTIYTKNMPKQFCHIAYLHTHI